jgi:hypothetical protein
MNEVRKGENTKMQEGNKKISLQRKTESEKERRIDVNKEGRPRKAEIEVMP